MGAQSHSLLILLKSIVHEDCVEDHIYVQTKHTIFFSLVTIIVISYNNRFEKQNISWKQILHWSTIKDWVWP